MHHVRSNATRGKKPLAASLLRTSGLYAMGAVLPRALSFAVLPLFTRYLPPSDYAIVGIGVTITAVLTLVYPLGMHGSIGRLYFTVRNRERRSLLVTTWLTVAVVSTVLTLVLDRFGAGLAAHVFRHVPFHPYLRIALWTAFFTALPLVPLALLQARQQAALYVGISALTAVASTGAAVILVVYFRMGARGYLLGALAGAIVGAALCVAIFAHELNYRPTGRLFRDAAAFGLPLVPHGLAGWVLSLSDRIILEHNVTLSDLGKYSIAFQIASVINFVAVAVNTAWSPELFRVYRREGTVEGMIQSVTYFVVGTVWITAVIAVLASPIMRILATPAYAGAERIIPWLAIGFLLNALYFIPVNFIMLHSKTGVVPVLTGISAVVNIALNLWLVPEYGVTAAAVSTAASYGLCLGLTLIVANRIQPVQYDLRGMGTGFAIVCAASFVALRVSIATSAVAEAAVRGLILVCVPVFVWRVWIADSAAIPGRGFRFLRR